MNPEEGTTDWGRAVPSGEHRGRSLLVREGPGSSSGLATPWVWEPPGALEAGLPEGCGLPLRIHVGQDGLRRVAAVGPLEDHIALAWHGGFELLCRHRQPGPELRQ